MKVCWVKIWIASMATLTERFRDDEGRVDFEALGREEYAFRHALITGDYCKSERARDLAEAAEKDYKIHSENGKKGGRPKKLTAAATTREGVDVVPDRESGSLERTTGCNKLTADGDIREDSLNIRDTGDRGSLESGTSANHYGQETTTAGKLATGSSHPAPETGTFYGRPQDRPERACCMGIGTSEPQGGPKSGNIYDQETNASTEALDKPGAGGKTPEIERTSASLPAPSPARPAKKAHGEFGNVMLTDDEYAKLCERFSIADTVIEEADQYFEAQPAKKKKYKSHYAMLLNWCKRKETEAKPKQGYMTSDDISKKNYQESKARLEAMFSGGRKTA